MKGVILFGRGFSYFFTPFFLYPVGYLAGELVGCSVFLEQVHYDPFLSSSYFFSFQFHFFFHIFFSFLFRHEQHELSCRDEDNSRTNKAMKWDEKNKRSILSCPLFLLFLFLVLRLGC